VVRDITAQRQAEQAVEQQVESLRVTLNSVGCGVIGTDLAGNITFINPVVARLTGRIAAEAIGQPARNIFRIIDEKTREMLESILMRVLRDGTAVSQLQQDRSYRLRWPRNPGAEERRANPR
jgi:PAS domain S-box-containing protein